MDEFLKTEYEQCLAYMKYYDDRHLSFLKFASGISSSVASVIFGFHKIGGGITQIDWNFISLVSGVTALGLLTLYVAMIQNRLYFVYPARQVNAIRRTMLESLTEKFSDNHMYIGSSFGAFKWISAHTLMNAFVALQAGVFTGLFFFSFLTGNIPNRSPVPFSVVAGVAIFLIIFITSSIYLNNKGKMKADDSVHQVEEGTKS